MHYCVRHWCDRLQWQRHLNSVVVAFVWSQELAVRMVYDFDFCEWSMQVFCQQSNTGGKNVCALQVCISSDGECVRFHHPPTHIEWNEMKRTPTRRECIQFRTQIGINWRPLKVENASQLTMHEMWYSMAFQDLNSD